jgi:hypothetical protein
MVVKYGYWKIYNELHKSAIIGNWLQRLTEKYTKFIGPSIVYFSEIGAADIIDKEAYTAGYKGMK